MTATNGCACCDERATEDELLERLDTVIRAHRSRRGALIPVLQAAQALFGYLPKSALDRISEGLREPKSKVYGVVTFYSFFSTTPRGKHTIRVCLGTACYVRGGKDVLLALCKELDIAVGGTTEDRLFTLEVGRCFGACSLAPAVMIDNTVHQRVRPSRITEMLKPYRKAADGSGHEAV